MTNIAIEFINVSKQYTYGFWGQKQMALSQLSLKVPAGSIFGFLGANGAGKTTAIKLLLGLQFPTKGEIKIFGVNPSNPIVKSKIGFLPERPYLHDTLTASEFLDFHRNLFGQHINEKLPSNEELLQMVGLQNTKGKYIKDFSKGMLQRIGIAQALVNNPQLIILDEPMSGLDPIGRKEVRDLLVKLSKQGKTIFFSSHILSDIESICHRIAFLEKGVLKKDGNISELLEISSNKYEVIFSNIPSESLKGNSILSKSQVSGNLFILKCTGHDQAKEIAQEIWKINGTLISLQHAHSSLEEILFGGKNEF